PNLHRRLCITIVEIVKGILPSTGRWGKTANVNNRVIGGLKRCDRACGVRHHSLLLFNPGQYGHRDNMISEFGGRVATSSILRGERSPQVKLYIRPVLPAYTEPAAAGVPHPPRSHRRE